MEDKHIMIDLETMGNESGCAIVSLGAVEFDIQTGKTGSQFYCKIDLQSCLDVGLQVKGETINFWLKQSEDARKEIWNSKEDDKEVYTIDNALMAFGNFYRKIENKSWAISNVEDLINSTIKEVKNEVFMWSNGARQDIEWLAAAFKKCKIDVPWNFRNERCVRTLVSFCPRIKSSTKQVGELHNAIDDCLTQIKYCSEIYNILMT